MDGCYGWMPLLLCCAFPITVGAEELPDPTRPPIEVGSASSGRGMAPVGQAAASEKSGLQSIIISPSRRSAIIFGHEVELGGKLGNATLVEVSEGGVVLESGRGGRGKRTLSMFPGVQLKKRAVVPLESKPDEIESTNKAVKDAVPEE